MNFKWLSLAMKFPIVSRLHVTGMAQLIIGGDTGDLGTLLSPRMKPARSVDCLSPLRSYRSPLHLVRYSSTLLSYEQGY